MNKFQSIIKEICDEENIDYSLLSKDWITMLEKDGQTRFIAGYKFDLNSHGFGGVVDDKYATYDVLIKKQIPIIKHQIIFNTDNHNQYAKNANTYEIVEEYFKNYQEDIVLKKNDSTCGNEVYHITKKEDLKKCLANLFSKSFSISLCPYYKIKTEYRLIILKNKCVLMYGKIRPVVVGDGKKTLEELLLDFNPTYFKNKLKDKFYQKVLAKGEAYEYSWQFNLSKGAKPFKIENSKQEERLLKFLNKITNAIDIGFCSIDIIETEEDELLIMELNSGIMMENYITAMPDGKVTAKKIYKAAIKEMFK